MRRTIADQTEPLPALGRLIGATLGALLVGTVALGTSATASPQEAAARPSASRAEDARVLAYWTPQRIANAKVRDYVRTSDGKLIPHAKPAPGGGVVTGASWPNGGDIQKRSGRILFSSGGSDWICSGSVVNDSSTGNGYSVVLTAGHCVYDGAEGWSYNFLYLPNFDAEPSYDCATRVNGCWRANLLSAHDDFLPEGFGTDATVRVDYGGSSGGPWIYGTTNPAVYTSGTLLTSVNSYSYSGLQYMFGPKFTTETQTVFSSATSGTASPGVSVVCAVGTAQPNC